MFMQIVPNSHSFGSLENILVNYKYQPEELTREYLLTGFENTLKRETDLEFDKNKLQEVPPPFYFTSVENIITFLEVQENFDVDDFVDLMKGTLANGYDLKNKFTMEKNEVYNRVDGELNYQDLKWVVRREENGTPDESKPPAEWINYIEWHLSKAKERVYFLDDEGALEEIRKVTALGVRALMIHGCPERVIPEELLNGE